MSSHAGKRRRDGNRAARPVSQAAPLAGAARGRNRATRLSRLRSRTLTAHGGPSAAGPLRDALELCRLGRPRTGFPIHYERSGNAPTRSYAANLLRGRGVVPGANRSPPGKGDHAQHEADGRIHRARRRPSRGSAEASADIYIVHNGNSSGVDSLRNRIIDANNHPGHDTIGFRIPGPGPHTITPLNTTSTQDHQPGDHRRIHRARQHTPDGDRSPVIQVAINATNHSYGLELAADDSIVRGLSIHSAGVVAGQPGDAIRIVNGDGNRVEGNYLGLDATGAAACNASDGVEIAGDDKSSAAAEGGPQRDRRQRLRRRLDARRQQPRHR